MWLLIRCGKVRWRVRDNTQVSEWVAGRDVSDGQMKGMNSVLYKLNLRCPWISHAGVRRMRVDFSFGLKNLHLRVTGTNVETEVVDEITQVNCAEMSGCMSSNPRPHARQDPGPRTQSEHIVR